MAASILLRGELHAHVDSSVAARSVRALKVDEPLELDGVLDEPFWKRADIATGFINARTQELDPLITHVRIAYTRTHLYVGVECWDDNMEEVNATERREDRFYRGDDYLQLHIDPGHNHRTKYGFFSNPIGTRLDGIEGFSGSSWTTGWSAEWDLAAKMLDDRWVFEMRIPFGAMNFRKADGQSWGINFTRWSPGRDSISFWNFSPTDSYRPHNFGHLTDLDLADATFDRNLEVAPYVSGRRDFGDNSDSVIEAGVDTSFRLTPYVIAALTLNPDFGQVEADADTIELRDTERFLPERRLFFREGSEILRMQHRLYYSRRFTDIAAGAKVSGEHKNVNFTFLNIQGDTVHGATRRGNSSVARAVHHVGEKSSMGYYLSAAELEDGYSRVAGVDGYLFLTDDVRFAYQASLADDFAQGGSGRAAKDRTDYLGFGALSYEKYPFYITAGYDAITEGFDPTLSLIFRRNIFGPRLDAAYRHDSETRWYKELDLAYSTRLYRDEDGKTILRDYALSSRLVFPNDFGIRVGHAIEFHDPYDNYRTFSTFSINSSDFWRSMTLGWAGGVFQGADYNEAILGKPFKPLERLPIRYELSLRFEELPNGEDKTAWLNRVIFDYFIMDDMWVKSSLQHRNDSIHNISVIYAWKFRPKTQWYFVFNSVEDRLETANSIFTKLVYTMD